MDVLEGVGSLTRENLRVRDVQGGWITGWTCRDNSRRCGGDEIDPQKLVGPGLPMSPARWTGLIPAHKPTSVQAWAEVFTWRRSPGLGWLRTQLGISD